MAVTVVTVVVFSATLTLAVAPPPSLVMTGATFTVMLTTSISVSGPPVPLLPRSSVVMVSVSAPVYPAFGV